MNISRALSIPGWMSDPELRWLAETASRSSRIIEIGAWMGRSSAALSMNTDGIVVSVDTWEGSEEHKQELSERPPDWLFRQYVKNTQGLDTVPLRMSSLEAARLFSRLSVTFDFVFIDASHDYENVKADILAWRPLVAPGGVLSGHDYNWPGVQQAVDELLPSAQNVGWTSIWVSQFDKPA